MADDQERVLVLFCPGCRDQLEFSHVEDDGAWWKCAYCERAIQIVTNGPPPDEWFEYEPAEDEDDSVEAPDLPN